MSSRKRPRRAGLRTGDGEPEPRRNLGGWYAALVLGAGAFSGIAALVGLWPFGPQVVATNAVSHGVSSSPIQARAIFPPVRPVHKVLDVYDLAPPAQSAPAPGGQQNSGFGNLPVIDFPAGPMTAIEATCEAAKQAAENHSEAYKQSVELQCEAAKQAYEQAHP